MIINTLIVNDYEKQKLSQITSNIQTHQYMSADVAFKAVYDSVLYLSDRLDDLIDRLRIGIIEDKEDARNTIDRSPASPSDPKHILQLHRCNQFITFDKHDNVRLLTFSDVLNFIEKIKNQL